MKIDFKQYWNELDSPLHAHNQGDWAQDYAKEINFYLPENVKRGVYAGCGNGAVILHLYKKFGHLHGIDFSNEMIKTAKKNIAAAAIGNTSLYCGNIIDIVDIVQEKVDVIFNNHVIQYLNESELIAFLKNCHQLLAKDGKAVFLNVPNKSLKFLYTINFYREKKWINPSEIIKRILDVQRTRYVNRLKGNKSPIYDGIGYWYAMEEIEYMANEIGFNAKFMYAFFPPYGYRFNVELTKRI